MKRTAPPPVRRNSSPVKPNLLPSASGAMPTAKKMAYVSPYKQSLTRGSMATKVVRPKLKPISVSVEELMQRVHLNASLSLEEGRLKSKTSGSYNRNSVLQAPGEKLARVRRKRRKNEQDQDAERGSSFLTGGVGSDGDWDDEASELSQDSTQRSLGSLGSLGGSLFSQTSMTSYAKSVVSLRAMVYDIETRARNHREAPDYVPSLSDLPQSMISWNAHNRGRRSDAGYGSASPKINIIPCHQPVQLLLAKAYERSSKLRDVLQAKQTNVDDRQCRLILDIQEKVTRAEIRAAALKLRQKQAAWMKICLVMSYIQTLRVKFAQDLAVTIEKRKIFEATTTLALWFRRIIHNRIVEQGVLFRKKAGAFLWRMMITVKVLRKRFAVRKIVDFLRNWKGNNRLKIVIHKFLASAHLLQKTGRSFIACNNARLHTMCKIWDALELQYIIKKLDERRRLELNALKSDSSTSVVVGAKMLIEMNKQADKWKAIDAKMERSLMRHRQEGLLPNADSVREIALTKMLPWEHKKRALQQYIAQRRKAFVLLRDELKVKRRKNRENFTTEDAHDLINGQALSADKIAQSVQRTDEESSPFLLFLGLEKKTLAVLIERVHDIVGTFAIKLPTKKGAGKKASQPGALDSMQMHPQIVAARRLKEEQEKSNLAREQERIRLLIDAASNQSVGVIKEAQLHLHASQKRRRGNIISLDGALM